MSVNTHRTVHVGRHRGVAVRAFDEVRRIPVSMAPLVLAAAALTYMVNLREAHFDAMVQLISGWVCLVLLFGIGRVEAGRTTALRLVFVLLAVYITLR